ncbi:MAG: hypothetical protein AAFQ57_15560 [Cyanobacteria bacterium J06626_14]
MLILNRQRWLLTAIAVQADTIRTPIRNTVTVQGRSGGNQSSQCGFISDTPNHQLVVGEPLVALRFTLEGQGQPTLAIQDEQGRIECVMSHQLSDGTIELPGAWEAGRYNIFVGDRSQGRHGYSLSVRQER